MRQSVNRTKIEWATHVWNPIKGPCPVGCWYCYARRLYGRFHADWPPGKLYYPDLYEEPRFPKAAGARIFVCSTMELFYPAIGKELRNRIFGIIEAHPEHVFIVLTKMPDKIDQEMPKNAWLGVSVTNATETWRINRLLELSAGKRFVSYEPMFGRIYHLPKGLDWIIMGQLTGAIKKPPERDWVERLVGYAREQGVPVFLKNNLASIWGGPLIQEFPK